MKMTITADALGTKTKRDPAVRVLQEAHERALRLGLDDVAGVLHARLGKEIARVQREDGTSKKKTKHYEVRCERTLTQSRTLIIAAATAAGARERARRIALGETTTCTNDGEDAGEWLRTDARRVVSIRKKAWQ